MVDTTNIYEKNPAEYIGTLVGTYNDISRNIFIGRRMSGPFLLAEVFSLLPINSSF